MAGPKRVAHLRSLRTKRRPVIMGGPKRVAWRHLLRTKRRPVIMGKPKRVACVYFRGDCDTRQRPAISGAWDV